MATLNALMDRLWEQYAQANSQAATIHAALQARGETVVNDHVAFRTFDLPKVGIEAVTRVFKAHGYVESGQYTFEQKKLKGRHYEHPDGVSPLIFVSELKTAEFSEQLQDTVKRLVEAVPDAAVEAWDFPASGVLWPMISYATYEALRVESEYAAWTAGFGYGANHFTVSINALDGFDEIRPFNEFIKGLGYGLNASGGEVKGTPAVFLEQSSTLADPVAVAFSDGTHSIPCCYYEFAKRYAQADGKLFRGFVAQSADKIFESTKG
ncbi:MAG: DUF1338 domain-containing protein [Planctomycetes bacterium]|nr:DUF1338 domain-containing protein [Planctomycetota bacterium]